MKLGAPVCVEVREFRGTEEIGEGVSELFVVRCQRSLEHAANRVAKIAEARHPAVESRSGLPCGFHRADYRVVDGRCPRQRRRPGEHRRRHGHGVACGLRAPRGDVVHVGGLPVEQLVPFGDRVVAAFPAADHPDEALVGGYRLARGTAEPPCHLRHVPPAGPAPFAQRATVDPGHRAYLRVSVTSGARRAPGYSRLLLPVTIARLRATGELVLPRWYATVREASAMERAARFSISRSWGPGGPR